MMVSGPLYDLAVLPWERITTPIEQEAGCPRVGRKVLETRKIAFPKHCHYTNYSILAPVSEGLLEKYTFII
jgi:hypothetical protein